MVRLPGEYGDNYSERKYMFPNEIGSQIGNQTSGLAASKFAAKSGQYNAHQGLNANPPSTSITNALLSELEILLQHYTMLNSRQREICDRLFGAVPEKECNEMPIHPSGVLGEVVGKLNRLKMLANALEENTVEFERLA